MPKTLDAEAKQAIAARLQYYRDLGVYDFYLRSEDTALVEAVMPVVVAAANLSDAETESPQPAAALPIVVEPMDRAHALRILAEEIGPQCTRCVLGTLGRKQMVFGVGDPNAELMFVGEGPGADEDEQGEPFVGRAGQLLNKMIEAMGVKREQVYIANVVKCRPPGNRTPEREECDACSPFLMRQIDIIKPKAIVALGAVAAKTLLGLNETMANLRSRSYDFRGTKLFVTYHPAFLLRDPRQKSEAWKDLQRVMHYLGLQVPQKPPAQ